MWFLYIVRCIHGVLYVGISADIEKRIVLHNAGKGARFTRMHRPVKLIYCEKFVRKGDALRREHEVKKLSKARKEYLVRFGPGIRFPSPQGS